MFRLDSAGSSIFSLSQIQKTSGKDASVVSFTLKEERLSLAFRQLKIEDKRHVSAWKNLGIISQEKIADYFDIEVNDAIFSFSSLFYKHLHIRRSKNEGDEKEEERDGRVGDVYYKENVTQIKLI